MPHKSMSDVKSVSRTVESNTITGKLAEGLLSAGKFIAEHPLMQALAQFQRPLPHQLAECIAGKSLPAEVLRVVVDNFVYDTVVSALEDVPLDPILDVLQLQKGYARGDRPNWKAIGLNEEGYEAVIISGILSRPCRSISTDTGIIQVTYRLTPIKGRLSWEATGTKGDGVSYTGVGKSWYDALEAMMDSAPISWYATLIS